MKSLFPLLAALVLVAPSPQDDKRAKPMRLALTTATFRKGQFRPGLELKAEPPLKGWKATLGPDVLYFLDMDGDGALTVEKDALAVPPAVFAVPIPDVLLTRTGQFDVSFEGVKTLILARHDLGRWSVLTPELALMTSLRMQAGVRPARFKTSAAEDCEKHLDYLQKNGGYGKTPHDEDPGKPGYTPEGAKAGKSSNMSPSGENARDALMSWYLSAWHRVYMIRIGLKAYGFAMKHGMSMLHFAEESRPPDADQCHPPGGAVEVALAFGPSGERPNPVPGTDYGKGTGFPILVFPKSGRGPLKAATLTDAAARAVAGTFSDPSRPANSDYPSNGDCAAFIPSKPLLPMTNYKVRFEFKDSEPLEWTFVTGRS